MSWWGWALWLAAVALSFAYFEWRGLTNPKKIPLTAAFRLWFRTREKTSAGRLGRVLFLVLFTSAPVWWLVHVLAPGLV
jgi:hypothetical protein